MYEHQNSHAEPSSKTNEQFYKLIITDCQTRDKNLIMSTHFTCNKLAGSQALL